MKGKHLSKAQRLARKAKRKAKRQAAKTKTVQELSEILGAGLNQTYEALQRGDIKGAIRLGTRWFIPDAVIERLISGEAA